MPDHIKITFKMHLSHCEPVEVLPEYSKEKRRGLQAEFKILRSVFVPVLGLSQRSDYCSTD